MPPSPLLQKVGSPKFRKGTRTAGVTSYYRSVRQTLSIQKRRPFLFSLGRPDQASPYARSFFKREMKISKESVGMVRSPRDRLRSPDHTSVPQAQMGSKMLM